MLRPPLVTDPVVEIAVRGTLAAGGSSVVKAGNVFYYRRTAGGTIALPGLVAAFVAGPLAAQILAQSVRYSANLISARVVSDPTAVGLDTTSAAVGAIATDSQPSLNTVVIDLKTATRGRAGRGRKFFAGVVEASTTGDILTGAGLALWQVLRDALDDNLADGAGNTWTTFVLSKFYSDLSTTPTVIYGSNVVTAVLNKRLSSMDKRRAVSVV